jgi:hypothetical protein
MTLLSFSGDFLYWIFIVLSFATIFMSWGHALASKLIGLMSENAANLPRHMLFTVVHTDKICTVLRETAGEKRIWTVDTKVFADKPLRPKDFVRRVRDIDEMKELNISISTSTFLVVDNSAKG